MGSSHARSDLVVIENRSSRYLIELAQGMKSWMARVKAWWSVKAVVASKQRADDVVRAVAGRIVAISSHTSR